MMALALSTNVPSQSNTTNRRGGSLGTAFFLECSNKFCEGGFLHTVSRMNQTRIHLEAQLTEILFASPLLERILKFAPESRLPDWHLCAGCLTQTVWNALSGYTYDRGIDDIDLIYFDADDLSEASEAANASLIARSFPGLASISTSKTKHACIFGTRRASGAPFNPIGRSQMPWRSSRRRRQPLRSVPLLSALRSLRRSAWTIYSPALCDPTKHWSLETYTENKIARWRRIWPDLTYLSWSETE